MNLIATVPAGVRVVGMTVFRDVLYVATSEGLYRLDTNTDELRPVLFSREPEPQP